MVRGPLQKTTSSTWFLDSCAPRHLCNNRSLFRSTQARSIDFVTAAGQIIRTNEIGTVAIPLSGGKTIELHNVAFAPECDSNLISLGQLRESGITYHDDPTMMTLMKDGSAIAHAKRERNLFILDLAIPGVAMSIRCLKPKAMAITGRGRPTHLVSRNKRIRVWHRRLAHASNARVVRAAKLTDGINLSNTSNDEYGTHRLRRLRRFELRQRGPCNPSRPHSPRPHTDHRFLPRRQPRQPRQALHTLCGQQIDPSC